MTHLSIFVVLSIVFIVVYLYYTISDVKKVHAEVKKITQDVEALNKSITNITGSLMPLLAAPAPSQPQYTPSDVGVVAAKPIASVVEAFAQPSVQQATKEDTVDDISSADSEEIQTMMETIDDEDDIKEGQNVSSPVVDNTVGENLDITTIDASSATTSQATEPAGSDDVDLRNLSVEELKTKVSYEDMRRFLKSLNMNVKGTKEVLIQRIKGQVA